ncbi:MAG: hypothetical protein IT535_11500, partial [Bauldia sp.]|nr:hypothetical protein [Bauldia sp.]
MSFRDGGGRGGGRLPPRVGDNGTPLGPSTFAERMATLRHLGRLVAQIWRTSRFLTIASIGLRVLRAVQPVIALYIAKLIIDEVVLQTSLPAPGPDLGDWFEAGRLNRVIGYLALEFAVVVVTDLINRAVSLADSILGELHSNQVSVELMQHAAELDLRHFESS